MKSDPFDVVGAITLSRATLRKMHQNLLWAVAYNSVDRIIKIPPSMMLQPWTGSDMTNDDLVKESSVVEDYTHAHWRRGGRGREGLPGRIVAQARGGGGLGQARVQDPRRRPPAAPATSFSSVSVITNALRLRRVRL